MDLRWDILLGYAPLFAEGLRMTLELTVIAIVFAAVSYWRANGLTYRRFIVQPASLAIALTGLYWTIQRAMF